MDIRHTEILYAFCCFNHLWLYIYCCTFFFLIIHKQFLKIPTGTRNSWEIYEKQWHLSRGSCVWNNEYVTCERNETCVRSGICVWGVSYVMTALISACLHSWRLHLKRRSCIGNDTYVTCERNETCVSSVRYV